MTDEPHWPDQDERSGEPLSTSLSTAVAIAIHRPQPVDDDRQSQAAHAAHFNLATHNGYITIHNRATGNHRTFRIETQPASKAFAPGERIVSLLTGPNNERDYTGFGFVKPGGKIAIWRKYRGEPNEQGEPQRSVWEVYASMLERPQEFEARGCEYLYEGRCIRCNRVLTTPESLARGIGPYCDGRTK